VLELSSKEQAMKYGADAGIGGTFGVTMILSLVMNVSTHGLWSLINVLQVLHYMPMFTLYFPTVLLKAFSFVGLANMENEYLSFLFLLSINESQLEHKKPINYRFENQGYESTSILINCSDMIAFLSLLTLYYICVL
jgi:hypothetical protein